MDSILETNPPGDRRVPGFKLDKNINLSAVIGALILFGTIVSYGNTILKESRVSTQKINIMWKYFVKDKPELQYVFPESGN